jgi:Phosphoglycerate kinase
MANTFFKAQGKAVEESLVENDKLEEARTLISKADSKLILPVDVVVADRIDTEAQKRTVSVGARRSQRLRAERGEMLAHPPQVGATGPPLGQLEHPLAGGADQLAGDRDHPAPERLRPLEDRPAQGLPLVEHEQVERQDLQLQVGVGAEGARRDAVDPEVLLQLVDGFSMSARLS